jgi:hypothetical protein
MTLRELEIGDNLFLFIHAKDKRKKPEALCSKRNGTFQSSGWSGYQRML